MKNLSKNTIKVIISIISGYLIHYYIISEVLTRFLYIDLQYQAVIYLSALAIQIAFIYAIITQVVNRKIDKKMFILLLSCYFLVLVFLLFGRKAGVRGFNFYPLSFIKDLSYDTSPLFLSLMNVLFFVPIGYLIGKKKKIISALFILLLCLSIESIQYIFSLGIFDIDDIILNTVGFYIGQFCYLKNPELFNFKTNDTTVK